MRSISVCLSAEPNPPIANPGLLICCSAGMLSLRFEATQIDEVDAARLASYLLGNAESLPPRCLGNTYQWRSVPRQITEQTRRDPGAIALEFGSELLTYAELDRRVNLLVSQLLTHGAGCEQRYALLLPQGIEFPIAALAVLRAGASYIPLDPSAPLHQLNRILKDACPLAILTLVSSQPLAEQLVCPVLYLDVDFSPGTSEVHSLIAPDDLAYVIYTSGSTGEPKGCMIEHRALSWLIEQSVSRHGIGPGDRVLQLCAVSFDASVEEIFTAWCAGATLVVRPPSLLESAESYLDFCEMAGLTIVGLYVSLLPDILRAMEQRGRFPATVRIVTTGGEIVPAASVERWRRFFADAGIPSPRLLNVYGLTETTVANLLADLTPESDLSSGVPIGAPLPGTRFRIAPDNLAAPSPGDVGELLLSGPQLARGYWSRPALTALRFVWDPSDGTRWFRTGDLVRISPSGALIVVGRSDRQVQLNGIRVELEGIERELQAHPSVSKAVVVCSQLPSLHPLVVAYWVPRPDHSLPPNSLRQFIADRLPAHAVPAAFVKLEALPLTPNGKIDHKALPFPTLSVDQQKRAAPSTYLERQLHGLWAEVLGRDDFGVTDNFFLVGGHSLSSARLSALIEEQLGRRLPLSVLFQRPTVKELSQWLESSNTPASFSGFRSLVTLQNRGEAPPLFVVHGGDGDVYIHLPLARCLAPHRPVYGLQAVGFDGSAPRHRSVAEMAAHYADEILRFQPSGPYHLLGYSGGGWYAWAVAAELHRRGATLGLIGLVDTGSTADLHRRLRLRQLVRRQLQQLPRRARSLAAADLSDWPAALNRRLQALQFITWTLLRSQGRPAPQALNPTASPKPTQPIRGDYFLQLHTYYRPPRLPLRADVFASCSQINHLQKLWNFYAQGLAVVHPCMENHVDYYNVDWMNDFAHQLESVLTRIESGSSS
jgi:amino acid adenylation domain-containing protein